MRAASDEFVHERVVSELFFVAVSETRVHKGAQRTVRTGQKFSEILRFHKLKHVDLQLQSACACADWSFHLDRDLVQTRVRESDILHIVDAILETIADSIGKNGLLFVRDGHFHGADLALAFDHCFFAIFCTSDAETQVSKERKRSWREKERKLKRQKKQKNKEKTRKLPKERVS